MTWMPIACRARFPKGAKCSNPWLDLEGAPYSLAEAKERGLLRALQYDADRVYVVVWSP